MKKYKLNPGTGFYAGVLNNQEVILTEDKTIDLDPAHEDVQILIRQKVLVEVKEGDKLAETGNASEQAQVTPTETEHVEGAETEHEEN